MTKAENNAEGLVFDLGLELPIIPLDVCQKLNSESFSVTYQERHLSSNKFCGISFGDETGADILINAAIDNQRRKNFTGAHEIGHVIMHIQTSQQSQFKCTSDDISGCVDNNKKFEKEANEFASALLMPKNLIGKDIINNDLSWQLVQAIYSNCQISLEAAARRVVRLSNDPCALLIHKHGEMWTPVKSSSFPVYINKIPFPNNMETSPDFADEVLSDNMLECDVADWLQNCQGLPETIFYSSIRNDVFDRTMTLLFIPEVDEENEEVDWDEPIFHR